MHNAIRKYGERITVTTLLEDDIEFCQLVEWGYRDKVDVGWNHGIGGASTRAGSKTSEETKAKLSLIGKGRKNSPETIQKMILAQSRRVWTDADRERVRQMALSRVGVAFSEEHRRNLSAAHPRDGVFGDLAVANARAFHNTQPPWERGRSNTSVWALSCEIADAISVDEGIGEFTLGRIFNLRAHQVRKVLKKVRGGWQPCHDVVFTQWLTTYKKEAANAAQTTQAA